MNQAEFLQRARDAIQRGDPGPILEPLQRLVDDNPANLEPRVLLINALMLAGRWPEVLDHARQIAPRSPNPAALHSVMAQAHNALGLAAREAGDWKSARDHFEAALGIRPDHVAARFNLAVGLFQAADYSAAAEHLEHLSKDEASAELSYYQAATQRGLGDLGAAREWMADALQRARQDNDQELLLRIGQLAEQAWSAELARDAFEAVREDSPFHADAQLGLAPLLSRAGDRQGAETRLKALIEDPDRSSRARQELVQHWVHWGDNQTAVEHSEPLGFRWRLKAALGAPPIQGSQAALETWRSAALARGQAMLESASPGIQRLEDLAWGSFYLAYQGGNDRPLATVAGDLIAGELERFRPDLLAPPEPRSTDRLRVGFLSSRWANNVVGQYFGRWPAALSAAGFHTTLYVVPRHTDAFTRELAARCDDACFLTGSVEAMAERIRADGLDLVILPEVGMDERFTALAACRLAGVQAAAWGHPDTTGLTSVDAFFSSGLMEPEDGDQHYREQLIRLPRLGTSYPMPPQGPELERDALGLPRSGRLYLFPHSPFKVHPDMDAAVARVLERDPDGYLVTFEGNEPFHWQLLEQRLGPVLQQSGVEFASRVLRLPMMSRDRYVAVNRACDVLLDTFHFSGGNTSLDALANGLPVVTWPGSLMRGRQTWGMLQLADRTDWIADSESDYVERALAVAAEGVDRPALRRAMEAVTEDEAVMDALGEACRSLVSA